MSERTGGRLQPILRCVRRVRERWPGLCWTLFASLAYTLAAMIVTYPLIFNLSSCLAGTGDSYSYSWAFWWVKQVILGSSKDLAHIPWMNHPAGLYHPFILTMLTVHLTALPLLLVFPPHVVYNLHLLSGFVLCGLSVYWFTSELTGNRQAGLVAGFVFGFSSNKMGHVIAGHLPQTLAYWGPLFALLLWRVVWEPSWRRGSVCGLVLVPALLVHPIHVAYFILPVTLAILFHALIQLRRRFFERKRLWALLLAFGMAALVVVPIWWPSVSTELGEGYLGAEGTVDYSTDLLALFTPSPYHPILGPAGWLPSYAREVFHSKRALTEGLAYPGLLALLLGIWGLVKRWCRTWIWGVLAVICLVLSLGPLLKVGGGEPVVYTVDGYRMNIVLPYALVKSLPLFGASRTPGRINGTTFFALAVLVAFGFGALSRRPMRQWVSSALAIILSIGILFETLARWPLPLHTVEIPRVIRAIAAEDGTGALLHVPSLRSAKVKHLALHYQTVHERPIVGGWIHRPLPEAEPWETTFFGLMEAGRVEGDIIPRPSLAQRRAWLRYLDIDYIILQKANVIDEVVNEYQPLAEELLGPAAMEDEALIAYPVPLDIPAPAGSVLYTFSRHGWHEPEQDGERWRRWMYNDGELYVYSAREEAGGLHFAVDSHLEFPVLEVYLDEQRLDALVVGERITYSTRLFTLKQGMNVFRFHAPGGCPDVLDDARCWGDALLAPPSDGGTPPCDRPVTCRSFVFDDVSFVSQRDLPIGAAADVGFGEQMRLRAWELNGETLRSGDTLTVTLAWEPTVELSDQYVVFLHLLASDGTLVAQHDAPPGEQLVPFSAWPTGTTFRYPVTLRLPDDLTAGHYRLVVGVYTWPNLERLDLSGSPDNALELGRLEIAP